MWSTAESRFARHVCLRHPFRPFHFGIPSVQSLPEAGSWEQQYAPPLLHYACIMPVPSLQLQKNTCLMQRSKGFGHAVVDVVVSKICYTIVIVLSVVLCDCCKPTSNCRDRAFSNSGLEVLVPVFQLPRFAKYDALPKAAIHSLPEAQGCWERQYAPPALDSACIELAKDPIPLSKIPKIPDLCFM